MPVVERSVPGVAPWGHRRSVPNKGAASKKDEDAIRLYCAVRESFLRFEFNEECVFPQTCFACWALKKNNEIGDTR